MPVSCSSTLRGCKSVETRKFSASLLDYARHYSPRVVKKQGRVSSLSSCIVLGKTLRRKYAFLERVGILLEPKRSLLGLFTLQLTDKCIASKDTNPNGAEGVSTQEGDNDIVVGKAGE
jgi:hypothetical protein